MTDTYRYSVSVAAAVIRDDGKALAIRRRDNGQWEPPGGVLEAGETLHAGLLREVEEETGMTIEPGAVTGVYQNLERDIVALVFRCHATSGEPTPSAESEVVSWLDRTEIYREMDEAYAVRLIDALEFDGIVRVRAHDGVRLA